MQEEIKQIWHFTQPPQEVWEYLTKPELLEKWLAKTDFQPRAGHKFRFISPYCNDSYCEVAGIWLSGSGCSTLSRTVKRFKIYIKSKKMEKKNFHRTITVNATAAEAMKKIGQVNRWWAKNFSGHAEKLNDKFTVRFGDTFVDFLISESVPDKKVVWKVTDCNLHWIKAKKEWKNTEVVFEISSEKNKTRIDFTHIGLVPGVECYNDCEVGWDSHVKDSLVAFINENKGRPE